MQGKYTCALNSAKIKDISLLKPSAVGAFPNSGHKSVSFISALCKFVAPCKVYSVFMDNKPHEVFLITGTNLGDREANLQQAITEIEKKIGRMILFSSVYETEPWGITDQPSFYNQVLKINTTLNPLQLLTATLAIEKEMGRIRKERYGARLIDIDILFFDQVVMDTGTLTLPHPRIAERNFVLAPLAEIAPQLIHPLLHQTILQIWETCGDRLSVKKIASKGL